MDLRIVNKYDSLSDTSDTLNSIFINRWCRPARSTRVTRRWGDEGWSCYRTSRATWQGWSPRYIFILAWLTPALIIIFQTVFQWREALWPHGWCARLRSERSGFKPWLRTLCCALGQDTLLLQCLSPPRCINGCRQIVGQNLTNCREVTCDGLASRPGEVEILLAG